MSLTQKLGKKGRFAKVSKYINSIRMIPMKRKSVMPIFIFCFLLLLPSAVFCADKTGGKNANRPEGRDAPIWNKGTGQKNSRPPIIERLANGVFRLGNIIINKPEKLIKIKGKVNMDKGLVEYLACGPGGKLHESVLNIDVIPYNLQIALLLIGLEPGDKPLRFQGDPGVPVGDPVEIRVSWKNRNNQKVTFRAEDLIFNKAAGKSMNYTNWLFTGSQIMDGQFMAQVEQSLAATYHDPYAILNHPLHTGGDDTLYFVNQKIVPAKGTPVIFEIKSLKADM